MLDFVILIACTYLIILLKNNKSITKRICSLILLVFFAFLLFFSTEDALISSWASKLIGEKEHSLLKDALTDTQTFSYAGNSVWLFYKVYLIISTLFYGCLFVVNSMKKSLIVAIFKFNNYVSNIKKAKLQQLKQNYDSKIFLTYKKLLN